LGFQNTGNPTLGGVIALFIENETV